MKGIGTYLTDLLPNKVRHGWNYEMSRDKFDGIIRNHKICTHKYNRQHGLVQNMMPIYPGLRRDNTKRELSIFKPFWFAVDNICLINAATI